jgi:hypothetical protein
VSGERRYDIVGREPMSDVEVEAAIAEWQADNPDQPAYPAEYRLRRLNADARQRAEDLRLAETAGVSVSAIREARAEKAEREAYRRRELELAAARAIVGTPPPPVAGVRRRGPRPMTTRAKVEAKRAELEADGEPAGERSIAKALGVSRDAVRFALGKDRRRPPST